MVAVLLKKKEEEEKYVDYRFSKDRFTVLGLTHAWQLRLCVARERRWPGPDATGMRVS